MDHGDVNERWLEGKPEAEYRSYLYKEMGKSYLKYKHRNMMNNNFPEEDIERERQKIENSIAGPCRHADVVWPAMNVDLTKRRPLFKYGRSDNQLTGKPYSRFFYFDDATKKYRYFHALKDTKDVISKAMDLAKCEYSINTKEDPGEYKWDPRAETATVRLIMKFDQRQKKPIVVYGDNIEELAALKAYAEYCKKILSIEGSETAQKLERLLACIFYSYSSYAFNLFLTMGERMQIIFQKSTRLCVMIHGVSYESGLLLAENNLLYSAWSSCVLSRIRRYRPRSTIRLTFFLQSLARASQLNEQEIIDSAQKIVKYYSRHRKTARGVFDYEISEKSIRRSRGIEVATNYEVSSQVKEAGRENIGAVQEFPLREFEDANCLVKLDYSSYKLIVTDSMEAGKVFGDFPLREISSMVYNDKPAIERGHKNWLKINGRKIIGNTIIENNYDEASNDYIDPARNFLSLSVDSIFTKKTLVEIRLHSIKLEDTSEIEKQFDINNIKMRLEIWSGNIFWTSTPYVTPKLRKGLSCSLETSYCIRVDKQISNFILLILYVVSAEYDQLPQSLTSLKYKMKLGFSKISLDKIEEQSKTHYVPLNNQEYNEVPYMKSNEPKVSLNMQIKNNVPGNCPESPLTGKAFNIGDLVSYEEEQVLYYPRDLKEFEMLERTDIKFDLSRANTRGSPLRYPANENEFKLANLDDNVPQDLEDPLKNLINPSTRIPFMFKLPKDKATFVNRKLPGNYDILKEKYENGIVTEMESYTVRKVGILRAIDVNDNCYLVSAEDANNPSAKIINLPRTQVKSMSEEGICVFDKLEYYPNQMTTLKHDWCLYLGFGDEASRRDFVTGMKDIIRDYYYAQRVVNPYEGSKGGNIKIPISGQFSLWITEARNLPTKALAKLLPSGTRVEDCKFEIRIGFRTPKVIADLFSSVYINDTLLADTDDNLKGDHVVTQGRVEENPNWALTNPPIGVKLDIGRLAIVPKSNILLTITVATTVNAGNKAKTFEFGTGEYLFN